MVSARATPPDADQELSQGPGPRRPGEKICWKIKLLPGEALRFPREKAESIYYFAREAESVPIQTSFDAPKNSGEEFIRGGGISQYEKFLFYRGVGDFSPPVSIRALGAGKVRVMNSSGGTATCLVLLTVSDGKIGFRVVDDLPSGAETIAELPQAAGRVDDLIADVKRGLIAAGLYEREAAAMIETWKDAWFREGGTRLLYTVPRVRTDELLPLSINPQPKQVVRVLVGRNDFLTPEQEAMADRRTAGIRAAQAEIASAEAELAKLGRFAAQARELAARRLEAKDPK
jgi:hypothetical protein